MAPGTIVLFVVAGLLIAVLIVLVVVPVRSELLWSKGEPVQLWISHPAIRIHVVVRLPHTLERLEGQVLGVPAQRFEKRIQQLIERAVESTRRDEKKPKPKKKSREEDENDPAAELQEIVDTIEPLVGPVLGFAIELPRVVRLKKAELTLVYGLGQPDWTGLFTGMIYTAAGWWPPPLRVRALPQWHRLDADVQAWLIVQVRAISVLAAMLRFGARYLTEWISIRTTRLAKRTQPVIE